MDLSLRELTNIFTNPELYSIRIGDEVISLGGEGVKVHRSNKYIEILSAKYIITIAMTVSFSRRCKALEKELSRVTTSLFTPYKVCWRRILSASREDIFADIVVQELPEGVLLSQYLECANEDEIREIYSTIDLLEESLDALQASFSALSTDDIIVGSDGLLYLFRYNNLHLKRQSSEESGCEQLRKLLPIDSSTHSAPSAKYQKRDHYTGHLSTDSFHEDRAVVEDPTGTGYVDSSNRSVIPSIYLSAESFAEGRAVVESHDGFGLINTDGEFILPAIYESMGYNADTGVTVARKDGKWAYFSYGGEQLTEFTEEYPDEDITLPQILEMQHKKVQL